MIHQNLSKPWGRGQRVKRGYSRSATELGMSLGNHIWRNGGRGDDLQFAYFLPCSGWPVASQGVPAEGEGCYKALHWGGRDLWAPLELGAGVRGGGGEGGREAAAGVSVAELGVKLGDWI